MKRSTKCLNGFFYIECKLQLWCLTILWKSRWMGGGVIELGNPEGRGLKQFWKFRCKGGGGSKNRAFCCGGVDFFWKNPFEPNANWFNYAFTFTIFKLLNGHYLICFLEKTNTQKLSTDMDFN